MTAVWMRLRIELRSRIGATVAIVVGIGLAGGVVLAAAAGARRTDTAYPRFLQASHAGDVVISLISSQGAPLRDLYADVERLPEVDRSAEASGPYLFYVTPSGQIDPNLLFSFAPADGRFGYTVDRPNLVEGRLPDPSLPTEGLANRFLTTRLHLHAGSKLSLISFREQPPNDPSKVRPSDYVRLTFTITGVGTMPTDVVPVTQGDSLPALLVSPAYFRTYAHSNSFELDELLVHLKSGSDVERFHREVGSIVAKHEKEIGNGGDYAFTDLTDHTARVRRAIRPQSIALALFAVLAAAAALLAIGQILARQLFVDASDYPILRSLGITRIQLVAVAMLRVALVAAGGGIVAVAVAFLASPIFPIGPARLAEPNPGFSANLGLFGLGFIAIVLSLVVMAAYPAWRGATAAAGVLGAGEVRGSERPSRVADAASRVAPSPSFSTGLRMALEPGHGRTAVPVRTALVGLIAAVAAVASAFTYGTSLNHLVGTPRLYGWNWDVFEDAGFGILPGQSVIRQIAATDPSISALSEGTYGAIGGSVTIRGKVVPAVGIQPVKGSLFPTIVEGRPPFAPDEIVLGASSLRAAHARTGDTITVSVNGKPRPMRIVGRAVFPAMGRGEDTPTDLGEGAMLSGSAFAQPFNFMLIRLRTGTDQAAFERKLLADARRLDPSCRELNNCLPRPIERPADIANYARVRATPLLLAGVLGLIAAAMIGHALVTSVRRRRHDLAILKTLGFVRRQVSATVAWQATTFAIVALGVGLPIGVAVGRWIWTAFADQLGVPPQPVVNVPIVLLAIPAVLLLANAIAAIPGRLASRTQPALVLRTE